MPIIDCLLAAPALVKVLASLFLIVILQILLRSLLAAAIAAATILALWCGHSLFASPASRGALAIFRDCLFSSESGLLALAILLVIALSNQMSALGMMDRLVAAVQGRLSRRWAIVALPAIIGWLPMPGGALFSAPLVDKCDPQSALGGALKAQANYWFRHIWEFWWPLYPGVLLALQITRLEPWELAAIMLPFTLVALAAGWYFLLRRVPEEVAQKSPGEPIWPLLAPIFLVVAVYAAGRSGEALLRHFLADGGGGAQRYLPMLLGILAAMWFLERRRPLPRRVWWEIIFAPRTWQLLALVMGVRLFGAVIEEPLPSGHTIASAMQLEISSWRFAFGGHQLSLPPAAFIALLPFVAGLSTGITVAYVGASFPVVFGMLGENPAPADFYAALVLALPSGYLGMMLSPIHACWVVTNQFFQASTLASLRGLIKPSLLLLLFAIAAHVGIKHFLPV
ncbi:MAG: DUF401 family protein [Planctomycetota bacterium]|nr:DUF401 family protein [Planctomycetota bacterium]